MSDEYTPTDQEPDETEEIEAFYTLEAMHFYYELGKTIGRAEKLCEEIDHEMKQRGYTPREEAIIQSCPF